MNRRNFVVSAAIGVGLFSSNTYAEARQRRRRNRRNCCCGTQIISIQSLAAPEWTAPQLTSSDGDRITFFARIWCADSYVSLGGANNAATQGNPDESDDGTIFEVTQQRFGSRAHCWFRSVKANRYLRDAYGHLYELLADISATEAFGRQDCTFTMDSYPHVGHTNIRSELSAPENYFLWAEPNADNSPSKHIRANRANDAHNNAIFRFYGV